MLQDTDHMEASCIFHVKVGTFDQLEQSKIWVLTITTLGIVMLTIQHDRMFSVCFMVNPREALGHTSPDVLPVEECPFCIFQSRDFSCCSPLFTPVHKHTTSDRHTANGGTVGDSCNLQQYTAGFVLSRLCKMAVTHPIST